MYDGSNDIYMGRTEFIKRLKNNDVLCVVAQALSFDSMGKDFDICNKNLSVLHRYLENAMNLIEMLKKHNLVILHENKMEK